jgi:hypothetical protein
MHYLQRNVRERINNLETFKPENCYKLGNILCDTVHGLLTGGWVCSDTAHGLLTGGWVCCSYLRAAVAVRSITHVTPLM